MHSLHTTCRFCTRIHHPRCSYNATVFENMFKYHLDCASPPAGQCNDGSERSKNTCRMSGGCGCMDGERGDVVCAKRKRMPPTRIERAIFALQVRRLTTWPRRLCLIDGWCADIKIYNQMLKHSRQDVHRHLPSRMWASKVHLYSHPCCPH